MPLSLPRRAAVAVAGLSLIASGGAAIATSPLAAASVHHSAHHITALTTKTTTPKPVVSGSRYVALGDSVPFGYRESTTTPTPDYTDASSFVGYPELVANALHLKLHNFACPGESTASFLHVTAASNGCENYYDPTTGKQETAPSTSGAAYRTLFPLHESYQGSQLQAAQSYLTAHPGTRLVTLMVGADDGLICQEKSGADCDFAAVIKTVQKNIAIILRHLRHGAGYQGRIVVVSYYSTDYSSATATSQSLLLDQAIDAAAKPYHVTVAAGFSALKKAAESSGGSTCTAGLLTVLDTTPSSCGIHPSAKGAALLAKAVEAAAKK